MPVRFHAVLREEACSLCHVEHVAIDTVTSTRAFTHQLLPTAYRDLCSRCHSGMKLPSHATTDTVQCAICHTTESWRPATIDHARVASQACDVCHNAPEDPTHASIAGNCSECHLPTTWRDKPAALPQ